METPSRTAQTATQGTTSAHHSSERRKTSPVSEILCILRGPAGAGEGGRQSQALITKPWELHSHPRLLLLGPREPSVAVNPDPTEHSNEGVTEGWQVGAGRGSPSHSQGASKGRSVSRASIF